MPTFLFILTVIVPLVGHGIWSAVAFMIRGLRGNTSAGFQCPNCHTRMRKGADGCTVCGLTRPSQLTADLIADVEATTRQIKRFHRSGKIDQPVFELLLSNLESERSTLFGRLENNGKPASSDRPVFEKAPASIIENIPHASVVATPPIVAPPVESIPVPVQ